MTLDMSYILGGRKRSKIAKLIYGISKAETDENMPVAPAVYPIAVNLEQYTKNVGVRGSNFGTEMLIL